PDASESWSRDRVRRGLPALLPCGPPAHGALGARVPPRWGVLAHRVSGTRRTEGAVTARRRAAATAVALATLLGAAACTSDAPEGEDGPHVVGVQMFQWTWDAIAEE